MGGSGSGGMCIGQGILPWEAPLGQAEFVTHRVERALVGGNDKDTTLGLLLLLSLVLLLAGSVDAGGTAAQTVWSRHKFR